MDLSQHSWYFVYAPNSDPKDEASSSDTRKSDFVEADDSTMADEMEQDIWDDEEDDTNWVDKQSAKCEGDAELNAYINKYPHISITRHTLAQVLALVDQQRSHTGPRPIALSPVQS